MTARYCCGFSRGDALIQRGVAVSLCPSAMLALWWVAPGAATRVRIPPFPRARRYPEIHSGFVGNGCRCHPGHTCGRGRSLRAGDRPLGIPARCGSHLDNDTVAVNLATTRREREDVDAGDVPERSRAARSGAHHHMMTTRRSPSPDNDADSGGPWCQDLLILCLV